MEIGSWAILCVFLLTAPALYASASAYTTAKRLSATLADVQQQLLQLETSQHLTPSKLAALTEFSEALTRCEELLLKVNRREIARAKARDGDGTYIKSNGAGTLKDQLRARSGLVAGRPAPHQ